MTPNTIRRLKYLRSQGFDLQVDKNIAGYRVQTGDGRRDISPRINGKELELWLEAFEAGYEEGQIKTINSLRRG